MLENPFPGMNPYMENPLLWRGHHNLLITYLNAELNQVLPLEYATRIEERVYVETWEKEYAADSAVVLTQPISPNTGGTAVLERVSVAAPFDSPLTLEYGTETIREPFLEIRSRNENDDIITVIEVLSPTNKKVGQGRDEYQSKQKELIHSWVHLLEIDLLRAGQYSLAPDETRLRSKKRFDYLVSLHRGGRGSKFDCWPILLHERLPRVTVPLAGKDEYVTLDLQTVVNRVYSEGGLWRSLRYAYANPPNPPLSASDTEWADTLLRERGLR